MNIQNIALSFFRTQLKLLSVFSTKKAGNNAFSIFCTPFFRASYEDSVIQNAEKLTLNFEGLKTVGYRWNKGASKKLLIAHGFRSASANFRHFASSLANKDYEVIAFDAPAHGLSEGKKINALVYKNFITTVFDNYGPFDACIAHSFGGLAISLNLEELVNNANIKTVLIAPAANTKQLCEDFLKELRVNSPTVKTHFYNNINRLSGKNIDWFSINRAANQIKGEVLWVHDHSDKVTPISDAIDLQQKKLSNFHFLFTEGLGHRRIYRDEKVIAAIINFL